MERIFVNLVPVESSSLQGESINAFQLTQYLRSGEIPNADAFPHHIDFGFYSPIIDRLYRQKHLVPVVSGAEKAKARTVFDETKKTMSWVIDIVGDDEVSAAEKDYNTMLNKQDHGERLTMLYVDGLRETPEITDTAFGEYTTVSNMDLYFLTYKGKQPLLEFHTHPSDSSFSPPDYYPMITTLNGKQPSLKGIAVLCPSVQLLAFATAQTPIMSGDKAKELVQAWKRKAQGEEGEEGLLLKAAIEQIEKNHLLFTQNELEKAGKLFSGVTNLESLTRRERRDKGREVIKTKGRLIAENSQYEKNIRQAYDMLDRYGNGQLSEFSRMINVVLYMSTNMRDFYKFSA